MMHSRGFVLSENQAFAGQTKTPGPSRLHASPTRKNMTTGKKALGQSSKLFGQEPNSAGPKELFKDLGSSRSPVKALGDRNASKTPGPSKLAPGQKDASPQKGRGALGSSMDSSPTKKGSSQLSPRKASTSNALRSLNGKQRQTTDPFSKPGQSDASAGAFKTPAPTQLGKARSMSRQNSFVTPAANVGRAGQIKARMGEIMDAEMGLSLQKGDNVTGQVTEQPVVQMSEEEMYPEIEYMPPSLHAKHPVFEFPDELDDLPRAKEVGAQLSRLSTLGIRAGQPDDLSDVEVSPMEMSVDTDLAPPTLVHDSDDDDPWPDVVVTEDVDINQPPSARPKASVGKAASTAVPWPMTTARTSGAVAGRAPTTLAAPHTSSAQRAMDSTSTKPRTVASTAGTRAALGKATSQPIARSVGLQRSIASAPGTRALSSSSTSASRAAAGSRTATAAARGVVRPTASAQPAATVAPRATMQATSSRTPTMQPARQFPTQKRVITRLNPKLIDFVDDDLGKHTEAALDRLDADEALEPLQLDLGDEQAG
ncbi:hypothetical protein EX895_004687 [Sporisorium graminicola]|uniref:Uncharacterized protein n=1 Tax=Sporisorium graminicola TaxID=280036 RepID=A0A4U7KTE6_9BASI|nr:hypothetical protein EX895_004687 [Sporisorium graminicola]TKY86538.1 hypothetical protein EX895_004687 [Sporisorium graminicola]